MELVQKRTGELMKIERRIEDSGKGEADGEGTEMGTSETMEKLDDEGVHGSLLPQ